MCVLSYFHDDEVDKKKICSNGGNIFSLLMNNILLI